MKFQATPQPLAFGGWSNCLRLSDGRTEIVVTTDVGPRIMRFAFPGGPNVFKEFPRQMGKSGGTRWRIFGGHRLWHAPEVKPDTYTLDHGPIDWKWDGRALHLIQPVDPVTLLEKRISISYLPGGALRLVHRLTNRSKRPQRLAPWALTVMAPGGRAIFPQEPVTSDKGHLLPARPLVLWKYTDLADPRWTWGREFFQLRQDARAVRAQKAGWRCNRGWMAYALPHALFIKRHPHQAGAEYPDFGCNVETYTSKDMLELESLAPLATLAPGKHVEHVEVWGLFPVRLDEFSEATLRKKVTPLAVGLPSAGGK